MTEGKCRGRSRKGAGWVPRCIHLGVLLGFVDTQHGVEGGTELCVQRNLKERGRQGGMRREGGREGRGRGDMI